MARRISAVGGIICLLLDVALGNAALGPISAAQGYTQTIGWLNLPFDGLSLYFALLGLLMLGLALLTMRWAAGWQLLPLGVTYLIVQSYALGEWPLWLRLMAEVGAAGLMLMGIAGLLRWGKGYVGVMLTAWGMVGLAVCSAEPSAVAGGLLLAANAALIEVAISDGAVGRDKSGAYGQTTFKLQLSTFNLLQIFGLWLYLHAALRRGELLYAALMLGGMVGMAVGLLWLRPRTGWPGWLVVGLGLLGFGGGGIIVDMLLRPALAGLGGLPAWSNLKLTRLDLPAPQPDAGVGIGLQAGNNSSLLPLLALALALVFALALGWLLYRVIMVIRRGA